MLFCDLYTISRSAHLPFKCSFFQTFIEQPETRTIIVKTFDLIMRFIAEDVERMIRCLSFKYTLYDDGISINSFTEIDRLSSNIDTDDFIKGFHNEAQILMIRLICSSVISSSKANNISSILKRMILASAVILTGSSKGIVLVYQADPAPLTYVYAYKKYCNQHGSVYSNL